MASRARLLLLAAAHVLAQNSSTSMSSSSVDPAFSYTQNVSLITTNIPTSAFTGSQYTYETTTGQRTVTSSSASSSNATASASNNTQITRSTTSQNVFEITGTATTGSGSASSTSSSATATNTVPCNNYAEFCNRKYSNITEVCAHNSAFAIKNNAASNQVYGITTQLNDGIRMREWLLFP